MSAEEKINEAGREGGGVLSERIIQHTACCDCVILNVGLGPYYEKTVIIAKRGKCGAFANSEFPAAD